MSLEWVCGQLSPRALRRLVVECASAILLVSVGLAYASPPDPSWIFGVYDDHDYDDVVGLVTDATGVSDSPSIALVEPVLSGLVLDAAPGHVRSPIARRQPIRSPPIETRDSPIHPLLTSSAHFPRLSKITQAHPMFLTDSVPCICLRKEQGERRDMYGHVVQQLKRSE
jgi:hypothetical protein